jgi:hypothetical protein
MANSNASNTKPSTLPKRGKKKYSPPTLTVYGTVRELTCMVGQARALDGGANGAKTAIT